jgi:hypothetical protein
MDSVKTGARSRPQRFSGTGLTLGLLFSLFSLPATWSAEQAAGGTLPKVDTSGLVPSDAAVIFDGHSTDRLVAADGGPCNWPVEGGALICDPSVQVRQQGLWTKFHFRDAQIHAEFMIPARDPKLAETGNSGLYLHGLFELQIIDSFDTPMSSMTLTGSLYGFRPPLVNAARPRGQWQTFDIVYRAPRRDAKGEPIEPGSVTALLNGVLVQNGTTFLRHVSPWTPLYYRTTPYAVKIRDSLLATECGPLQLQNHESPVRFRNIWIRPLDHKAFLFEPGKK